MWATASALQAASRFPVGVRDLVMMMGMVPKLVTTPLPKGSLKGEASRDCQQRVLRGAPHSGRTLYAKARSEPYAKRRVTGSKDPGSHIKPC